MKGFSVFRRAGRPVWYITFLSADSGSWKQAATDFRLDDPTGEKRATRLAEHLTQQFYRSANASHKETWAAWVRPYLARRYRPGLTLTRYLCAWENLAVYLQQRKIVRPGQWQYDDAQRYVDWRTAQVRHNGKKFTRNTAIFELKLLGTLMGEALRRGYVMHNPLDKIGLPRDPPKEKRELTDADLAKLRAWAAAKEKGRPLTERWRTVSLEIAMHQGCRLMETSVAMSEVDEVRGNITFAGKGRDGRPRIFTTSLHPALGPLMRQLRAEGATRTCHLPKMAGKEWFFGFREAGVEGASFHCTRVTVITRMARAGVPVQQAMRFVNHSSRAVHAIYQRLKPEDLSACTAVLNYQGKNLAAVPAKP